MFTKEKKKQKQYKPRASTENFPAGGGGGGGNGKNKTEKINSIIKHPSTLSVSCLKIQEMGHGPSLLLCRRPFI